MISRYLRWISQLDRSYFFALSAIFAALLVSITLAFAPVATTVDGRDLTLIQRDGAIVVILLILPVVVLASPLISLPQQPGPRDRSHKINSVAATAVLLAFAIIAIASFGLFYAPALIFSSASSVSLYFGKSRKPAEPLPARTDPETGLRLSRSGLRRLREQERIAAEGGEVPEPESASPLASSRRRRGRHRRKR